MGRRPTEKKTKIEKETVRERMKRDGDRGGKTERERQRGKRQRVINKLIKSTNFERTRIFRGFINDELQTPRRTLKHR